MKIIRKRIGAGVFAVGVLFASVGVSQAVTLGDLLVTGAVFVIGDKMFYDFGNVSQIGDISVPFNQIGVSPISDGPMNYGISFQSGLWMLSGPDQTYDLKFDYSVKSLGGPIKGNELFLVGGHVGGGTALVAEVVTTPALVSVANQLVWLNQGGTDRIYDADSYLPETFSELHVHADFALQTGFQNSGDSVFVSYFGQSFSQVASGVPDGGATLALLSLSLGGISGLRRILTK